MTKSVRKITIIRLIFATCLFSGYSYIASAQSGIDSILKTISVNNKTLIANQKFMAVKSLGYKTGITPPNPTIEYDYLKSNSANIGGQHEFQAVQSFDFPSAYSRKNQLVKIQIGRSESELNSLKQDILLEAKYVCIELIYHSKLSSRLLLIKNQTASMLNNFQKKLQSGEGNILDVNKAKLQLIEINNKLQQALSSEKQLQQKLTELNGGIPISFVDTAYNLTAELPTFEVLEQAYEKQDPMLKILEQDKLISQKQLEVSRALSFPKMELGYRYVNSIGQEFNGIHTGITIPLWESKNTVLQKKAALQYSTLQLDAHVNEHYFHIKHLYEKYLNLKSTLNNYKEALYEINSPSLLEKALDLGHISTIEYFMEMQYFNSAYNAYLETEKEYQKAIAELLKYQL